MQGLYQRGSVWWFRFTMPGRGQVRLSTGETDEAEAIRFARDILDRPERVDFGTAFSAEVAAFIAHRRKLGRSESWTRNAEIWLNAAMRHFGDPDPRKVSSQQVQAWIDGLMKAKRPQTVATYAAILTRFMDWLLSRGTIRRNPCQGVLVPAPPPSVRRRFLTPPEAQNLLRTCRTRDLSFALFCALHAGLRKEEVIQARPSWFDLDAGLLHITGDAHWHPKDRDNRTIPLTKEFQKWLKARKWPGPFMMAPAVTHGRGVYRYDFRGAFKTHLAACGLADVTFHDLRRTFASLLVSKGVSLYKVGKWLGDGHAVVERTYGHLLPNDDQINEPWAA